MSDNGERSEGGGSLELKKNVIEILGLSDGSISGNQDFSHKLQLIFHDVFKQRSWVMEALKTYFSTMQSMNTGKAGTKFQETAEDLENIVLTNKTVQLTRFVKAFLRAIETALRNLPTINAVIGDEYSKATLNRSNTKDKEQKRSLDNLMDAETLFLSIGVCQLLESYCQASLES